MATTSTISFDGWSENTQAFVPTVAAGWGGLEAAPENLDAGGESDESRGRPADGLLAAAAVTAAVMAEQASASPAVGTLDLAEESGGQAVAADTGDAVGDDAFFTGDGLTGGALGLSQDAFGSLDEPQENGSGATTLNVLASGNQQIDGLLSGVRWAGAITYADTDNANDYQAGYFSDSDGDGISAQNEGFSQFSAQQMIAMHYILNDAIYTQLSGSPGFSVEGFTNLSITYNGTGSGTATLRYANSSDAPTAYAYYPNNNIYGGDSFFGVNARTPVAGNYSWMTMIHELGHSLGLAHGHTGGAFGALPANVDSHEYSIMTYRSYIGSNAQFVYNEAFGYPQTYMMFDIAALQYMYGADFTINGGNTTYTFSPTGGETYIDGVLAIDPGANRIFNTIWDGNGIDTYDLSNYTTNLRLDLRPGEHSTFSTAQLAYLGGGPNGGYARGNLFNALQFNGDARSLIENAIGGTGNDTITGNDAANTLTGGGGGDALIGGLGNDTYRYVAPGNIVAGESISDSGGTDRVLMDGTGIFNFRVMAFNSLIEEFEFGIAGASTLQISGSQILAAATIDGFSGGAGSPNIVEVYHPYVGGSTNISGFTFQDWDAAYDIIRVFGNTGNETLTGDNIYGTEFYGGAGADTLIGGAGNDIYLVDGSDTVVEAAGGGTDIVYSVNNLTLSANVENGVLYAGFNTAITIAGNSGANNLYGNEFANTLISNGGLDFLYGGLGNDTYLIDANGTVVEYAGQGNDTVYSVNNLTLGANIENGVLYAGFNTAITIAGNGGANNLYGNEFANTLISNGGLDFLLGGLGNDTYLIDANGTVVENAGQGIDTVYSVNNLTLGANIENGVLYAGFNTAINITGNSAANRLVGNEFGNLLSGLGGNDILTGGAGGDYFLFETGPGADVITDFNSFDDQFILRGAAFNLTAGQALQTGINFIASAAPTVVAATATILFNTSNGGIYLDPDGTGGIGAILFAGVGGSSVSNLDFMII